MATDKLINQSQGDDIIDALDDIATNLGNISYGEQTSSDKVVAMTGYQKESTAAAISPGDSLNVAIGKLEKKVDDKVTGPSSAVVGNIATFANIDGKSVQDSEVAIVTTMDDESDAEVPTSEAIGEYISDQKFAVGLDSSTANHLVKFKDNNGKNLEDTGIAVETSSASALSDDDDHIPTSKLVKTEVDKKVTSIKAPVSGSSTKVDKNNEVAFQQATGQSPAVTVTGDATNGTVTIEHQTGSGFNHLPKSGADGKYLKWKTGDDGEWVAPDSTWPANPDNKTIPGTKLVDDRFKTNETDIQSMQSDIAALEGLPIGRLNIPNVRDITSEEFVTKTWSGLTSFNGWRIWTDGRNIYYSEGADQYVLDKSNSTWSKKTWFGLTSFYSSQIWTDGENIYYSNGSSTQYVLNKSTSTWSVKTWNGLTDFYGSYIWSDGENIYCSNETDQYVLNKSTSTWSTKTWTGLTSFYSVHIWTDGENIYYSMGSDQYVLNKVTSTWSAKTWFGFTSLYGKYIWTDGRNIYYSNGTGQYVLDKSTSTWNIKTWTSLTSFSRDKIWTDGINFYYSSGSTQYLLKRNTPNTQEVMGYVNDYKSEKGAASGVAELDANGKVPSSQLPSSMTPSSHTHGSITNDGTITAAGVALANGDSLVFVDSSDSSKIKKTSVTFDGSTTTKALTPKGTFETFLQSHQTVKQDGVTGATVNRFGTCSTAAATAAKTVSITSGTFNLEAGARVSVKFTNANTADTPTLNVNSKGTKNIYSKGSQITTGSNKSLLAGTVDFIYDGTQWHLIGNYIDTNTTYSVATTSANGLMSSSDKSIVNKLSSTTYTAMTPADSNISILRGGYIVIGKLCIVNVAFKITSGYAQYTLFINAPIPACDDVMVPLVQYENGVVAFNQYGNVMTPHYISSGDTVYEINAVYMVS